MAFFPVNSLRTGKKPPRNSEDAVAPKAWDSDHGSGRVTTILGYSVDKLTPAI
jgi:hypothetical protein